MLASAEEAGNLETEPEACETETTEQTEEKELETVEDNLVDTESASAQVANASETGARDIESAVDSEAPSKEEGVEERAKTEATEAQESSVQGDDQKMRFVVFCLLEQWLSLFHWLLC